MAMLPKSLPIFPSAGNLTTERYRHDSPLTTATPFATDASHGSKIVLSKTSDGFIANRPKCYEPKSGCDSPSVVSAALAKPTVPRESAANTKVSH
jgi:hypothetical protein